MAVASNTLVCNGNNAPAYVSSSAYYGYVPPNLNGHQLGFFVERSVQSDVVDGATHNLCGYGSAMETDDDGYDHCEGASCLNNPCVIPEGLLHDNGTGCQKNDLNSPHRHNHLTTCNNVLLQGRGRKRNSVEDLSPFEPPRQIKRYREGRRGGGNGCVYHDAGNIKEYELATTHYRSSSLRLGVAGGKVLKRPLESIESCYCAAGNYSLSNPDHNGSLFMNGSMSYESDVEYERMLLETHGCSAYQHHRAEAEF